MKFVHDLLKVKSSSPQSTAQLLSMHTVEVDRVIGGVVAEGVITGKIIDIQKHPNADRLRIVTVDIATAMLDIVTGAPNVEVGQIVAVAPVGAKVLSIDHHLSTLDLSQAQLTIIKPTVLRGIESPGMLCGADEIGLSHVIDSALFIFPNDTKIGVPIESVINSVGLIETDDKGTAHRPDLLSYRGIECELSAILDKSYTEEKLELPKIIDDNSFSIDINDKSACTLLLAAKITRMKRSQSPKWLVNFMHKHDLKSINLFSDATNYIMLREGHPTHAFDGKSVGSKLLVRLAHNDDKIAALDHKQYIIDPDDIVLANSDGALDVAGIIGAEDSAAKTNSDSIILTCAVFNPTKIRQTSRRLGVRTEASSRFERGLSTASAINAFTKCLNLIISESGGTVRSVNAVGDSTIPKHRFKFDAKQINAILGLNLSENDQIKILKRLQYRTENEYVIPPWWRSDVNFMADVAEDVGRIYGYDRIPSGNTRFANSASGTTLIATMHDLRHAAAQHLYEIVTPTMTAYGTDEAIEVANPIGNLRFVRQSLVTSVLKTAEHYTRLGYNQYGCFEIGRTYRLQNNAVIEKFRFSACIATDLDNAKSIVGQILHRLHINTTKIHFEPCPQTENRPVKYHAVAHINYDGNLIGHLMVQNIRGTQFCVFKLYVNKLDVVRDHHPKYHPYSKFPSVKRDVSVLVSQDVNAYDLQQSLEKLSQLRNLLDSAPIITQFSGLAQHKNHKALTIKLSFRSNERTLTDAEVNRLLQTVESMLKTNYNATIR